MAAMDSDDDQTRSFTVLAAGTRVSHYKIISKIGAGGMGEVYLAEDTQLDRKVALKFLPPHLCQDEASRARFTREAKAAAKLDHPNIVQVFEVSEFQGRPFFAMAHIDGRSLRDVIREDKLSINEAIELTKQICEGLHKAHNSGVVHRDIKPGNIIIDEDNKARILDFGLATVAGENKLTKTGSTLGTVGYMSPEQTQGQKVDQQSDIWSLGVILYEMISGRVPFEGEHSAAIAYSVVNETPHPLARYRAEVPDELQRIVNKCLAKCRDERYQSASDLIADLKALRRASTDTGPSAVQSLRKRSRLIAAVSVLGAAIIVVGVALVSGLLKSGGDSVNTEHKMLAVLPFQNLGDPKDEYFADGITDEITSRLAAISGLRVIARASAAHYKNRVQSVQEIAQDLGVDYILEGTIRWDRSGSTNLVRITPELIEVDRETQLWSERYQRSLEDIFTVQSEIAQHITRALDIVLLPSEQRRLDTKPTQDLEAYDYFLRGNIYRLRGEDEESQLLAITMYKEAVKRDPDFALAHATLAHCYMKMYWEGYSGVPNPLETAKAAVDIASEIAPNLADVHLARADYFYHGLLDYDRALNECELALRSRPSDPFVLVSIGAIKRRQGKWLESVDYMRRGCDLDPRNAMFASNLGISYRRMRRFADALHWFERSIAIYPAPGVFAHASMTYFLCGNIDSARVLAKRGEEMGYANLAFHWAFTDFVARQYSAVLSKLHEPIYGGENDSINHYLLKGEVYNRMEETEAAEHCFDSARLISERCVRQEKDGRQAGRTESHLGLALAKLGRKDEAIAYAMKGTQLMPVSKNFSDGTARLFNLALVYTSVGEHDLAVDLLDSLLSIPSDVSAARLKLDPQLDPLRNNPRFQALVDRGDVVF